MIFLVSVLIITLLQSCDILQNLAMPTGISQEEGTSTGGGGLPPKAFFLLSPQNGQTGVSLTPTFQWEPSLDPEGSGVQYSLLLTAGEGGNNKVTSVPNTSYTIPEPLQPLTTYYWRVTAKDIAENTYKTPFYSFTTGDGEGGEGTTGFVLQSLTGFSQSGVRKGVVLHNPAIPNYLVYVFIDEALYLYALESTDGGDNWTSMGSSAPGSSYGRDLAAALDGNGNTIVIFVNNCNNDEGDSSEIDYVTKPISNDWNSTVALKSYSVGLKRLPSVVHTTGNEYLFAYGYDNYGSNLGNDTYAQSVWWNGSYMDLPTDVGLHPQTDNPVFCQQIAFDPFLGEMYYLYFDNHVNFEPDGGDMFVVRGSYPSTWFGYSSEVRVVDVGPYERVSQGYLFKGNGEEFILIYAVHTTSPAGNVLYMKHASTVEGLELASPTVLEGQLQIPQDSWGRYRTVYGAQDASGDIHVVFQDQANTIKWIKLNSATYTIEANELIASNQYLDSISVGQDKLYISTISDVSSSNSAAIYEVSF